MLLLIAGSAFAGTASGTLGVSMGINGACVFSTTAPVSFVAQGVLSSAVTANGTINVQCTDTLPYTIALAPGPGTGTTSSARKMTDGGATVSYAPFREAGLTQNWGNTAGTDASAGAGSGAVRTVIVYGQVPTQTTPAIAAVTITY